MYLCIFLCVQTHAHTRSCGSEEMIHYSILILCRHFSALQTTADLVEIKARFVSASEESNSEKALQDLGSEARVEQGR